MKTYIYFARYLTYIEALGWKLIVLKHVTCLVINNKVYRNPVKEDRRTR